MIKPRSASIILCRRSFATLVRRDNIPLPTMRSASASLLLAASLAAIANARLIGKFELPLPLDSDLGVDPFAVEPEPDADEPPTVGAPDVGGALHSSFLEFSITGYGLCEGDCDSDLDCDSGLVCFQRIGLEDVPGCEGEGIPEFDYCITKQELNDVGRSGTSLGLCQGDCDSDSDCLPGLRCMQRSGNEPIPHCSGTAIYGWDYCVSDKTETPSAAPSLFHSDSPSLMPSEVFSNVPSLSPSKITASPSHGPTRRPTRKPTVPKPTQPLDPNNCTPCSDTPTPWMDGRGLTCSTKTRLQCEIPSGRNHAYWVENKFCQNTCFEKGYGYAGDNCCPEDYEFQNNDKEPATIGQIADVSFHGTNLKSCMGDCDSDTDCDSGLRCMQRSGYEPIPECSGTPSVGWDYCLPEFTPSPTLNPTMQPTPPPVENHADMKCVVCTDVPTNWMVENGIECKGWNQIPSRCTPYNAYYTYWERNRFCELSCFNGGSPYPGAPCCEIEEPQADEPVTESPTSAPTVTKLGQLRNEARQGQNLDVCEGDCDSDEDCRSGYTCFHRFENEEVPFCSGVPRYGWDYCLPAAHSHET